MKSPGCQNQPAERSISIPVFIGFVRIADVLTMLFAGLIDTLGTTAVTQAYPERLLLLATLAGSIGAAVFLLRKGAYSVTALASLSTQIRLFLAPLIIGGLCAVVCLFVLPDGNLTSRAWPVTWMLTSLFLLVLTRLYLCPTVRRWGRTGRLARKVAIVGVGEFSREVITRLLQEPITFQIIGVYDDRLTRVPLIQAGIPVRGTVAALLQRSREETIDIIVVALPLTAIDRIARILENLSSAVADICLTTDIAGLRFAGDQFEGLGGNSVLSVGQRPLKDWRALQKLVLDYTFAALASVILSPILLFTALLIRLDSPGPILFRQQRMGFNNKTFVCYKFRTMHHSMTDLLADKQTALHDPRITRIGRYLRKLSVDELPQLLNVFGGSMSLVGPRPHALNTKAADQLFADVVRQYAVRHRVKPGITGWAQVNGWRGETKTVNEIQQRVACDLFYIAHWSILFDLKIMVMTVLREVRSRRAY
jgi:Undecaprenyl-phosphate glucose phosphotransferase